MLSVIDARALPDKSTVVACDVCIIGAGAAGIYLATRLASKGMSIIILEAGGEICTEGSLIGVETILLGSLYRGATEGRAFGLGGSTSSWGGLLFPHTSHDCRVTSGEVFDPWQHIVGVVKQRSSMVSKTLGINIEEDPYTTASMYFEKSVDILQQSGLDVGTAEFLPFRKKNLTYLLKESKKYRGEITIYLNAVVNSWEIEKLERKGSRLNSASAKTVGRVINVSAPEFVIAAGAIESARMLLEIQRLSAVNPFHDGMAIGKYLSDHLSCSIARIGSGDWRRTSKLFGPRFFNGQMRSFRFVERSPSKVSQRYFAHFIFENENHGFHLAKKILSGVQSRKIPSVTMKEISRGTTGLFQLAWYRWFKSRLYLSPETPMHLQLDIEQHPDSRNRIILNDELDVSGRPIAILEWEIHKKDYESIHSTTNRILANWPGLDEDFPKLIPLKVSMENNKPHDAYHPVGTCRLGTGREAVVDPSLKVYGMKNLSLISTAVFPTAGTANPTYSMLCLGEDLADRLSRGHRKQVYG